MVLLYPTMSIIAAACERSSSDTSPHVSHSHEPTSGYLKLVVWCGNVIFLSLSFFLALVEVLVLFMQLVTAMGKSGPHQLGRFQTSNQFVNVLVLFFFLFSSSRAFTPSQFQSHRNRKKISNNELSINYTT